MEKKRCPGCMQLKSDSPVCEHCGYDERRQNAPHQLPAGTVLKEQYLVGKVLGQGGFGITYLGWDMYLDAPVAIKEYYPTGAVMRECDITLSVNDCTKGDGSRFKNSRERFLREAKMLARFSDVPQIVQVRNFFLANNTAYIIMEYVKGITLKQYVEDHGGSLSVEETMEILRPVMEALCMVHKTGLVHRDITPDNIMMLPEGGAKLLDFGAVREINTGEQEQKASKSTAAILKQGYAPLEQYQKKGNLGPWTDVYGLSATMYYCLTGEVPPEAPERVLTGETLNIRSLAPGLTERQEAAIVHGMALRVEDRTESVDQLYQELFDASVPDPEPPAEEETPTQPVEITEPEKPKRPKWLIPVIAVAAVAVLGLLLTVVLSGFGAEDPDIKKMEIGEGEIQDIGVVPEETRVYADPEQNTLMEYNYADEDTAASEPAFRTGVARGQVLSVTFLDTLDGAPEEAADASALENGMVKAWAVPNGELYDLYIAANGGVYAPSNSYGLFYGFENMTAIHFGEAFCTDNLQSTRAMFYNCGALTQIDLSGFHTEKVTDMAHMFRGCASLKTLDVSGFNTETVTDLSGMFMDCASLTALDLTGFDTSGVTDMSFLFWGCASLKTLDLSALDTAKATAMESMFRGCSSLTELDVSGFDTGRVTNMSYMFTQCTSLTALDLSGFRTSKVTNMNSMFKECSGLTALDISSFDTVRVTDMTSMFYKCRSLTELDVSGFKTANVVTMENMFYSCGSLTELDVSGFKTGNVTNMMFLFSDCSSLKTLDVSGFDTKNVTTMRCMFQSCTSLEELNVSNLDTRNVTDMSYMFSQCSALKELNASRFRTGKVTEMIYMFYKCSSLKTLDVSGFDTSNVTSMSGMFRDCASLTYLGISNFDTSKVTDMEHMFSGCAGLNNLALSGFKTSGVMDMQYMFYECRNLKMLDLSSFDTANVTNMNYMLYGCDSLTSLNPGTFDTGSVTEYEGFMEEGKRVNGRDWTELFV